MVERQLKISRQDIRLPAEVPARNDNHRKYETNMVERQLKIRDKT